MTDDLIAFLRARLDEDEQTARLVPQPYRLYVSAEGRLAEPLTDDEGRYVQWAEGDDRMPNHITNWDLVYDPARMLREVEAKRRIVAAYKIAKESAYEHGSWEQAAVASKELALESVLRLLAVPYADHPDYRDAWKP